MMRSHAQFSRGLVCVWLLSQCVCQAGLHPVPVDEHSNCAECHANHANGAHVHPAVALGCNSCHVISTRDGETRVEIKQGNAVVCRECHPPEKLLHAHFQYASSMCVRCHNPHVAANPKLLRTKVNELCLACHLYTRDKVQSSHVPLIELTKNNALGHPYQRHPVAGFPDPLSGGEMSCISCHLAHGGTLAHYQKMGEGIPEDALNQNSETYDMCRKCHLKLWGLEGAKSRNGKKKLSR